MECGARSNQQKNAKHTSLQHPLVQISNSTRKPVGRTQPGKSKQHSLKTPAVVYQVVASSTKR